MTDVALTSRLDWNRRRGAHVEASRIRVELTRAQLAARVGVSEETIRRWERGGSRPSDERLVKLIAVLALDGGALQLRSGDDERPPLARRLRRERADRRITQSQAGAILGVAQPTYAGWEVGRSTPDDPARVAAVAEFLGVTDDEAASLTRQPFVVDVRSWPRLGRLMGTRRQSLMLTRADLAQRVGVTNSTIASWELGYRFPRVSHLPELASALEVTVAELEAELPQASSTLSALGEVIRSRQGALGLTRAEIAQRAGTDEATLSRWVHGHRQPGEAGLRRLARVLGVQLSVVSAGPETA